MNFINANKTNSIMEAKKKINKASYIISFIENDKIFGDVVRGLFVPNKKLLKQVVKQYNINKDLLIYGFESGKYTLFKLKWCI